MRSFFSLFMLLASYVGVVGFYFTNRLLYIKKRTDNEIIEREAAFGHFDETSFHSLSKEPFSIPSKHRYAIFGYIVHPYPSDMFIIISHGVTMNLINSVKYMNLFLKRGWNVIIYDHRRHGLSGGKTTSYGYYEKDDLQTVVEFVRKRFGSHVTIGIHGESMGAATTLLYAGTTGHGCDFYIVDCPFSSLEKQLKIRLKEDFRLHHSLVLPIAKPFLKLREGYDLKDVSPIDVVHRIQQPVLFIHSERDDYIPVSMTKELFEKKKGPKELFIAPKGLHAMSYSENRMEYEKAIDDFLTKYKFTTHEKSRG